MSELRMAVLTVLLPNACSPQASAAARAAACPQWQKRSGTAQRRGTAMQQLRTHLQCRHEKVLGNHRHDPEEHSHPGCRREAGRAGGPVTQSALPLCVCCMRSSAAPAPLPPAAAMQPCRHAAAAGLTHQ